ncbi:MAG: xanthine dehydrogenase family protein molybdopterin-binding subunit [Oscillospiraceae bacterium]
MALNPIIGSSIPRKDGREKVTGHARYGADINVSGQLYAVIYHSPHPHALIKSIDTSKARAFPGVRAVITGKDFPACYGQFIADQPIMAIDKVRYRGEPVAAVIADTERIAREAVRLVEAEYELLPVVDSIEDALSCKALVHNNWSDYTIYGLTHPVENSNIIDRFQLIHGDIEKGFAEADAIVENDFYCGMLQHAVIETHAALADASSDELLIYTPAQSPFSVRSSIAKILGYRMDQIRIICTEIGGGFGCKAEPKLEPIVAVLSKLVGRPVKLVYDRHEEFEATLTRAPGSFHIKTGATKDGKLTAQQITIYWDTGAYGTFGPRVNYNAGYASNGPYMIPNCYTNSYCMVTNHSLGSAYRGFGITEVACVHEMQMDELASKLGMDPLEFRLKNVLRDGMVNVTGEAMKSSGVAECLEKAAENIGWKDMPKHWVTEDGKLHGKGIACFIKLSGTPSTTSCTVRMNEDGSINIMSSSREMGQGVRTVLPQFAASVLGMDINKITVSQIDTSISPYDKTTTSSRSTFHSGNAVLQACEDIVCQLKILVGKKWKVPTEDVLFDNGIFTCSSDPSKKLHIDNIGESGVMKEEVPVIALGKYGTKDIFDPPDELTHQTKRTTVMWMMGAQAAEVEVDPKTGQVKVVQMGAAHDVGHAINPLGCSQQIEGAIIMGIGHALLEEMIYQDGVLKNGNMVDYKVPTFMDADVKYNISLVETAHPEGPYGAKGIGEPGVAPTAPAIANAVSAACEHRFHAIPIKPEQVLFCKED